MTTQDPNRPFRLTQIRGVTSAGEDRDVQVTDSGGLVTEDATLNDILDVLERIQSQLAMINEGENLKPGERHYVS